MEVKHISVLEINVDNFKKNILTYKNKLLLGQKLCFVAKSNCYGFGNRLCKYIDDLVDYFAVSCYEEFLKIKKYVSKPVLILDPIYNEYQLKILIKNDCELTICNLKSLQKIIKVSKKYNLKNDIKIHIAINTGMNRFGFSNKNEILKIINIIKKSQNIIIKGVFSHYYDAKCLTIANFQLKKFKNMLSYFESQFAVFPLVHICASDGVEFCNYGNMVRVGFGLYNNDYYDNITLKSKILDFKILNKDDTAGYNGIFTAKKKCKIAIIGIGYGDGIFRNIVQKGYVIIKGEFAKILAVCMDSIIVDVSNINCNIYDDVIILGKMNNVTISICDVATWCDTIGYEIIVRISERVKRVYRSK